MKKFFHQQISRIAMTAVLGTLVFTAPALANNDMGYQSRTYSGHHATPDRVEERIRTLHDKLDLTPDQEPKWHKVAEVMRSNERSIHRLVEERHEEEDKTAIDDLKSYEKIANAHADGLRRLIPAFANLYDSLSDDQKANADAVFGKFEGHTPGMRHTDDTNTSK